MRPARTAARARLEAAGDDAHPLAVEPQRAGDADRLGRHRVAVRPRAATIAGRADHDREAQGELRGRDLSGRSRARSAAMRAAGTRRWRGRGARFTSSCHAASWRARSSSSRKRRCLKKSPSPSRPDSRPSLSARGRTASTARRRARVERDLGEGRVPLGDPPSRLQASTTVLGRRTRRAAARRRSARSDRPGAHQRLDALVGDQRHLHPARVLQPRGEEVDPLAPSRRGSAPRPARSRAARTPPAPLEAHQRRAACGRSAAISS